MTKLKKKYKIYKEIHKKEWYIKLYENGRREICRKR